MKPRLRAHVEVEPRAGGARLHDRLLQHAFDFGPLGAALLARADGTRAVAELAPTPDEATILRRLFLLNLVEGAGDGMVARLQRVLSGELPLELQVLEGARFQCQGSGECCQNYVFGPLEDEDIARLEALPIAEHWPQLAGAPLFESTNHGGFEFRYLRSAEERCVFLEDDRRCGLHRRFGADAKPALCRIYPIEHMATYDGMRLFDKGSCGSFAISARSGPSIVDDLPRLRALLPKRPLGLSHPAAMVDEYPCDFGHFDRLLKMALGLVKRREGTAAETLRAISRGARAFAGVLRTFPLEAGEPDASLDRFFAEDPMRWYRGEPSEALVRVGAAFYGEVFGALLVSASNVLAEEMPRKTGHLSLRLVREGAQLFHLCASATTMAVDPAAPIDPYLVKALAVTVSDPEVDDVLRISLRQQLFGNGSLVESRFMPALVRMALMQILAVTGARLRAHEEGRTEARAADLSWGHMLAARVLAQAQAAPVLLATEERMTELLEALPLVLALDYAGTRRPMP